MLTRGNQSASGSVPGLSFFWVADLETGRERQLTSLGREFAIGDFDVSADGREIIFDRAREESDIVLLDLPDR